MSIKVAELRPGRISAIEATNIKTRTTWIFCRFGERSTIYPSHMPADRPGIDVEVEWRKAPLYLRRMAREHFAV